MNSITRTIAAACGAGVLLVGATACGSSGDEDTPTTSSGTTTDQNAPSTIQQAPGANGEVAAVDGSTAQVQSSDAGQVAVTWTATTTFTKQVEASLADVVVGDCVMVTPVESEEAEPDVTTTQPTEVTAASVRISEPTGGSCTPTGGPGGGPGGASQLQGGAPGAGGGPPEGAPDGAPDGARPQVRGIGGAFGTVSAVSANGFTVDSIFPGAEDDTAVTVTVAKATTYSTTAKGAASDVQVGVCVRAEGKTDSTGAVTATRIAVTPAVDGECTGGMVRFRSGTPTTTGQAS